MPAVMRVARRSLMIMVVCMVAGFGREDSWFWVGGRFLLDVGDGCW